MAKRKIAILGGGMAGLVAAWELTRTPELRRDNEVTVYQLGWRLGGKAASGRSEDGQILEHGLHIWFGCYDNAFRMLKDVYAEWQPRPGAPITRWQDAFTEQRYALFGYDKPDGSYGYHEITFDGNELEPGTGGITSSVWDLAVTLYETAKDLVHDEIFGGKDRLFFQPGVVPQIAQEVLEGAERVLAHAVQPLARLRREVLQNATHDVERTLRAAAEHLSPRGQLLFEGLSLSGAVLRGVFADCTLGRKSLDDLDAEDFVVWLHRHDSGLSIATSTLLRTMYDTFFWYGNGDPKTPAAGAGTAITVILRAMCTYKRSITFKMNAGMGEIVVAPLYEALLARGVRFQFFRKVKRLELSADRKSIRRVHIARQADTVGGVRYQPTIDVRGMTCWPAQPDFAQLVHGAELKQAGVNFESHWCNVEVGQEVLEAGTDPQGAKTDFTHLVLAVSLGAYKDLGNGDDGMCDELIAENPRFAAMTRSMGLVPSQAAQLWFDVPTRELTHFKDGYESVAGPEPQNIWADMSQTLVHEAHAGVAPRSVHYGCGTYDSSAYRLSRTESPDPLIVAEADVRQKLETWLNQQSGALWEKARSGNGFDFQKLWDPRGRVGAERLKAQYVRANISPTECCPGTEPGSSRQRLRSHESGFSNLTLAGCYIRTGLNTTCVEGAVMSGMQASRAICGFPQQVVGEHFGKEPGAAEPEVARPTLPLYVQQLGMGQMSHEAPLFVGDVQIHAFRLPARRKAMQKLVDLNLNLPAVRAGEATRFTVLGNSAMLAFLRSEGAGPSSPTNRVGKMDDRECALFIPLLQRDGLRVKLTAWVPYLFIDRPIGMVMGREVWGYTKSAAVLHLPMDPQPAPSYRVTTTILKRFAPDTVASDEEIVNLRFGAQPGPERWRKVDDLLRALLPELTKVPGKLLLGRSLTVVNLKQFRDVADSTRACYQALVECPMEISGHFSAGLLEAQEHELDIFTCDSHDIAAQFGLTGTRRGDLLTVKVGRGAWVRMNFTAQHGRVLWQAK